MNPGFWTDFADGAVMFPLGIVIGLTLLALRQPRAAMAWTVAIGCVWATMLLLKFLGYVIDGLDPASPLGMIDLVTPSGHVASASVIYGGLIGIVLGRPGHSPIKALAATTIVAVGIGLTRVLIGVHSVSEVLIGAVVGMGGVYWLTAIASVSIDRRARLPLLIVACVVVMIRYGGHLGWEQTIHQIAFETVERLRGSA